MMYRGFLFVVLASANEYCTEQCSFVHLDESRAVWEFDMSQLCRERDYIAYDSVGHEYAVNVCKYSESLCLPAGCDTYVAGCKPYDVIEHRGLAVQLWGVQPPTAPVTPPNEPCYLNGNSTEETCSRPCAVLGVGLPSWRLIDPSEPRVGVEAIWDSVPPPASDPYQCPLDQYGNPGSRRVTYRFVCGEDSPMTAVQLTDDPCAYNLTFVTKYACFNFEFKYSGWSECQPDGTRTRSVNCVSSTSTAGSFEYCEGEPSHLWEPCDFVAPETGHGKKGVVIAASAAAVVAFSALGYFAYLRVQRKGTVSGKLELGGLSDYDSL